ncbi:hypothetical protein RHGRI_007516 [Rhododendron griersonianum]|uniref:4-hydroxy-3-methylbut-2-enyl diphosphate reductase n=1 Tax=Rhododendron griersonianum TaxID=479676 RepID=A0AAV6KZ07_9ERIC|nr:hypothetical protein RHGRI_007516 [Rhododendron griersonianum]
MHMELLMVNLMSTTIQDLQLVPPPEEEILLFLKCYDPLKEELQYIGRLFVKANGKPTELNHYIWWAKVSPFSLSLVVLVLWRLEEMEVQNIPINDGSKQFDVVDKGDVVVLPAFRSAVEEMMTLSDKKVQIVDTTCPWLSKVWNTVEKHKKGE